MLPIDRAKSLLASYQRALSRLCCKGRDPKRRVRIEYWIFHDDCSPVGVPTSEDEAVVDRARGSEFNAEREVRGKLVFPTQKFLTIGLQKAILEFVVIVVIEILSRNVDRNIKQLLE